MPALRPRTLLLSAALAAAGAITAHAQPPAQPELPPREVVPPELEPFEGKLIRKLTIRHPDGAALDESTESLALNQLRLREGSSFSSRLVSEDISRINRLGRFKRVESRVQELMDGSVELIYLLEPQPLVTAVQTVGNRAFSDEDLLGNAEAYVGAPVDQTMLDRIARGIEARYRDKGYYNALVSIDQPQLEQSGIVLFRIREGERTRVSVINFKGGVSFSRGELLNAIKTREAWLLKKAPVDRDQLALDVSALVQFYRDRGYLDVRVDWDLVPSPDGREAIVNFNIDEGRVYTLRSLRLHMADPDEVPVFTEEQLLALMEIQPGDVYSDAGLKKAVDSVRDAYGIMGYADVQIIKRESRDTQKPLVDVVLVVQQGRAWKTGLVEIQGNHITRDDVIREHVTLRPDRPLDTTQVRETERRLRQTRLFNPAGVRVTLQPEDLHNPGYRDVLVQVEESNTGRFIFGGSIGSDGGLVGQISMQQYNFDITDTPDTFGELLRGGGGQTFTSSALPGTQINELSASLSDPSLLGSDYTGFVRAYYRTRDFSAYDEQRVGTIFSVGRRFGSRWNVGFPFRVERIELTSIDPDAPTDYYAVEDPRIHAAVGMTISRSSYDNIGYPTKGNRLQFGIDQFFGDSTFTRLSTDYDVYIRLSEDVLGRSTTLKLSTSVRYIPNDQDDVPFYERFYLGGQSFRGFGFRGASPVGIRNDNGEIGDDPIGGTFSFFAGAEVRVPVWEDVVSVVGFIDTGTMDEGISFDDYRVSVGAGLRLFVPQLSPAPLAFDFGFPLLKQDTDKTRIFSFSIDLPFQ
jgi:outer membrane protein insertion porin family